MTYFLSKQILGPPPQVPKKIVSETQKSKFKYSYGDTSTYDIKHAEL